MAEIRLGLVNISNPDGLRIDVREVNDPGTIVDTQFIPGPVPSEFNVLFSDLNDVVHWVDFRRTASSGSLGTLLKTIDYAAIGAFTESLRFYTVDGLGTYDPPSGQRTLTDPFLDGKIVSEYFKEGHRPLNPDGEWTQAGASVILDNSKSPFAPGETIVLRMAYQSTGSSGGSGKSFPLDFITVSSDTVLDSSYLDKMIECDGGGLILTITLDSFTNIPNGRKIGFNTHQGTPGASAMRFVKIIIPGGNTVTIDGVQDTEIFMGKGEELIMMKKDSEMKIVSWNGDHRRVGEIVYADIAPLNSLPLLGGWYPKIDLGRLWVKYVSQLLPSFLGTGSYPSVPALGQWQKWIVSGDYVWVPDMGGFFIRTLDPDGNLDPERATPYRIPGDAQADQVGQFVFAGKKFRKSGTGNELVTLANNNDVNLGEQDVTFNVGKKNRPVNIVKNAYVII
jgi:hypothetical protein